MSLADVFSNRILLVPFENGTRTHPELLADPGEYGDLTLCGNFGLSDGHDCYITTVMYSQQWNPP